jgi:hypothetical protein
MPSKLGKSKGKKNKQTSKKNRSHNVIQKEQNLIQSFDDDQKSTKSEEHKNPKITSKYDISNSMNSPSKTNKKIPPRYFDEIKHSREESVDILKNISLNCLELQKNILATYRESCARIINEIYNTFWKESLISEKYFEMYGNISKNLFVNITSTNKLINDIIIANMNLLSKSIDINQKHYNDFLDHNYYSKKS